MTVGLVHNYMQRTILMLTLLAVILATVPDVGIKDSIEEVYISYVDHGKRQIKLNYSLNTVIIAGDNRAYQSLAKELEARGLQVITATTPKAIAQALSSVVGKAIILASSGAQGLEEILAEALARGHVVIVDNMLYETLLSKLSLQAYPRTILDQYHIMIKPIDGGTVHFLLVNNISSATTAKSMTDYILKNTYTVLDSSCHQWLAMVSYIAEWWPYGRIDVGHQLYYYSCDGNPNEDPYYIVASTRIVPGKYLGWGDRGRWWSDRLHTRYDLGDPGLNLYDFEPANRQTPRPITVVVSFMSAAVSVSWGYGAGGGVREVIPLGLTGDDLAEWIYELDSGFWSAFPSGIGWPVVVEPSISFTAAEGSHSLQYWEVTGVWSRPGPRGMPVDTFQATLVIELHLAS